MIKRLNEFYTKNLNRDFCVRCGGKKNKGFSFCPCCLKQLPRLHRTGLYLPVCYGYEEHFELALEWLNTNSLIGLEWQARWQQIVRGEC